MTKKLYLVETVSIFRQRYVVEAREESHAEDEVVMNVTGNYNPEFEEFSQHHVDECITSTRELTEDQYFELFAKDNDYLVGWTKEQKKKYINTIKYPDEEDTNNGV